MTTRYLTTSRMGAVKGKEQIWSILGPLHEIIDSVEYILHHIAESTQGTVLTERTDKYVVSGIESNFPVMGSFVIEGNIIREWRDYFDLKQCIDQLPQGAKSPI